VYGFCDGKAVYAAVECQRRFPNCRIPTRIFVYSGSPDIARYRCTSPGVRILVQDEVNQGVNEHEVIVQMVHRSPCARTPARHCKMLHCPFCMQMERNHAANSECISDLGILLIGLLCTKIDKEIVYSVKAGTRDAKLGRSLDEADRITKPAEVTIRNARRSYPRGEVSCGGGWDFRKAALSTGQCILKETPCCFFKSRP